MLGVSTLWCPRCGAEFLARVQVCPDCEVELVSEPPPAASDPAARAAGEDDQVVYELHEWPVEARQHLDRLLHDRPHVWQGTDLVVPAEDVERTDALIDEVEATMVLALDPEAPKVAYDLADLDEEQLVAISTSLADEGIPHAFDDDTGELVVHEADEERVEAILDAVDFPDALPVDDGVDGEDGDDLDPLAAQEAMSDLFVAADRLRKDARDPEGMTLVLTASEVAAGLPLPYGFSQSDWGTIVAAATDLAALVGQDRDDDAALAATEEAADALRALLRPYV